MQDTYITKVIVDLSTQRVTLQWIGPDAAKKTKGPFKCSPGAGIPGVDCDDVATSKKPNTNCTPKGDFKVLGHQKAFSKYPAAKWVTRFQSVTRGIAIHYWPSVPDYPASHGCVRIASLDAAKLIHDNTKVNVSIVSVTGKLKKKPE